MANLLSIKKLINNKRNCWINSNIDYNKVSKKNKLSLREFMRKKKNKIICIKVWVFGTKKNKRLILMKKSKRNLSILFILIFFLAQIILIYSNSFLIYLLKVLNNRIHTLDK